MPWLVTLLVLAGALVPAAAIRDVETGRAAVGASLAVPHAYVALAPLCTVLDVLTLLSVRQHVALLLSIAVGGAVWRLSARRYRQPHAGATASGGAQRRAGIRFGTSAAIARACCGALAAVVVAAAIYAFGALVPRPMATLVLSDPALVAVDFHSHTQSSWDGRRGFDVERNRAWHQAGGFGAVYVTDHARADGALADTRGNPREARGGTVILRGMEARYAGNHVLMLGDGPSAAVVREGGRIDADPASSVLASFPAPLLIVAVPANLDSVAEWANGIGGLGAIGVELSDAAPRAFDFVHDNRAGLLALADRFDLAVVAGSDNHGWGRTAAAWSVLSIPGWRDKSPADLGAAIERELRTSRRRAVRVLERRRPDPSRATLALTGPAVLWTVVTTLSWPERASWLAWGWGGWLLCGLCRRRRRADALARAARDAHPCG